MTEPDHVWRQIETLLGRAETAALLVAPFIKKAVFEAVLAAIPPSVQRVDCVTRWTPAEVAAGVSDPEILDLASEDGRVHVALCPSLHAKVYRADDRCLIGSANLTGKATGRASDANIELLIEAPASHPEVQRVVRELEAASIPATAHMAALVRQQAELLTADGATEPRPVMAWYPVTRRPEALFMFYSGRSRFAEAVEAGLVQDLALMNIPAGLSEAQFNTAVHDRLHAIPELRKLRNGQPLSNTELRQAIEERADVTGSQAHRITEIIAAWLKHFGSYYTEVGSWELRHGRELG
ncbi:phospholipase D family protein [Actinosynnema sp. NPDC023794]